MGLVATMTEIAVYGARARELIEAAITDLS